MTRDQVHDSRGPVKGLFKRADGRYMAGYRQSGRYRMKTLRQNGQGAYDERGAYVDPITDAKRVQQSLLAGLLEGRIVPRATRRSPRSSRSGRREARSASRPASTRRSSLAGT